MNVHFQKSQLMYFNLYPYSDFMLFFFHTWNMFLVYKDVIYSDMKYVRTWYNVNKILIECHFYDNLSVFGLSCDKSIYRLDRAHVWPAFGSTKGTCHVNMSLLKQLKSFFLIISFIFHVYCICYLAWFMATKFYCCFKCFYLCLGISNIYIIVRECCFIDDLIFANAFVCYIGICCKNKIWLSIWPLVLMITKYCFLENNFIR